MAKDDPTQTKDHKNIKISIKDIKMANSQPGWNQDMDGPLDPNKKMILDMVFPETYWGNAQISDVKRMFSILLNQLILNDAFINSVTAPPEYRVDKIVRILRADYDAMASPRPADTLYIITDIV